MLNRIIQHQITMKKIVPTLPERLVNGATAFLATSNLQRGSTQYHERK